MIAFLPDPWPDLHRILARVTHEDPLLTLERESDLHWIVCDRANVDADGEPLVMWRGPLVGAAVSWARAHAARVPGARLDESFDSGGHSVGVLADVIPLRKGA